MTPTLIFFALCSFHPNRIHAIPFRMETFSAVDSKRILQFTALVRNFDFERIRLIAGRYTKKETKTSIDRARIRLHYIDGDHDIFVDANGNIDSSGIGGKIPLKDLLRLERLVFGTSRSDRITRLTGSLFLP